MKSLTSLTFLLSNIHQIQTKLLSGSHSNLNLDPLIHLWMPRRKYFENQTHHHIILLFNFCTAVLAIMYLMVSKRKEWRSKFGGQDKDAVGDITHNFTTPLRAHFVWFIETIDLGLLQWLWVCSFFLFFSLFDVWVSILFEFWNRGYGFASTVMGL